MPINESEDPIISLFSNKKGVSIKSARVSGSTYKSSVGSNSIPDVVGMSRVEAINTLIQNGIDYLIYYTSSNATSLNNDTVQSQSNDSIVYLYVYQYAAPVMAYVDFGSGELPEYVQEPYEPYNPYPNSGIVIGTGPSQVSGLVGSTITLPNQGDFQMIERKSSFVNSGGTFTRQIPDQIVYPDFVGWTDGQLIYSAGTSYTIPQPVSGQNIELWAVWQTLAYSPTFTSFSPLSGPIGTTVDIVGKKLASIERVYFRNNQEADFTVINDNLIQAIVPVGAITGRITMYTYGGSLATRPTNFTVS